MSFTRVAQNTVYQLAGRVISVILGIFALGVLTRYLGTERFGWYTTVMTFVQFFAIIADLGLTLITTQMISEPSSDENSLIQNIFTLRVAVSCALFGLACALVWFMPYNRTIKLGVAVASGSVFFTTLQNILQGLFQKHLRMERVALGDVIGRAAILIGFVAAIAFRMNLLVLLLVHVIANMLQFAVLYWFAKKYIVLKFAWHAVVIKKILARSWPIAISMMFNLIYLKADTLILSLTYPQTIVGLYGAAYRVIEVLSAVPVMFMGIVLPLLTFHWHAHKGEFARYFQNAFDVLALLGLPLVVGGMLVATPLMRTFAGAEFAASGAYLRILLLALCAIFFSALSGHTVVALNKQHAMVWGYVMDAAVSLALYFVLIPPYGARAAAWVTVFSEVFIWIMTWYMVWRTTSFTPRFKTTGKIILACALMALGLYAARDYSFGLQIVLGACIYILVVFASKTITKDMVRSFFKSSAL